MARTTGTLSGEGATSLRETLRLAARSAIALAIELGRALKVGRGLDLAYAQEIIGNLSSNVNYLADRFNGRGGTDQWREICSVVRTTSRQDALTLCRKLSEDEVYYLNPDKDWRHVPGAPEYWKNAGKKLGCYESDAIKVYAELSRRARSNWPDDIDLSKLLTEHEQAALKCAFLGMSERESAQFMTTSGFNGGQAKSSDVTRALLSAYDKLAAISPEDAIERYSYLSRGGLNIGKDWIEYKDSSAFDPYSPLYSIEDFDFLGYSSQLGDYIDRNEDRDEPGSFRDKIRTLNDYARDHPGESLERLLIELFPEVLSSQLSTDESPDASGRDHARPPLWSNAEARGKHNPASFVRAHYGTWQDDTWIADGLTKPDLRQYDPALYQALATWERRHPEDNLGLPTQKQATDSWIDKVTAEKRGPMGATEQERLRSGQRRSGGGREDN